MIIVIPLLRGFMYFDGDKRSISKLSKGVHIFVRGCDHDVINANDFCANLLR